jgi:hypothetical protein
MAVGPARAVDRLGWGEVPLSTPGHGQPGPNDPARKS